MTAVPLAGSVPSLSGFAALAGLSQAALDAIPAAVYLCAADGRVIRFNRCAAEVWGRVPRAGDPDEMFCGSFRLFGLDGTPLPHEACPMAEALRTGESFLDREVVIERPDGLRRTALVNITALIDADGRIEGAINCFLDITARKEAEERQRLVVQELKHRVKNTLATVHSLAKSSARGATSVEDFTAGFAARIRSLDQAHSLLGEAEMGVGVRLRRLLEQQLEPFRIEESAAVSLSGVDVELTPRLAVALAMVFHELMTNAAKYGALSGPGGQVAVEWHAAGADGTAMLEISWTEMGGPPVEEPRTRGFGTRLIERTLAEGLGGTAALLFEPAGLRMKATVPLVE